MKLAVKTVGALVLWGLYYSSTLGHFAIRLVLADWRSATPFQPAPSWTGRLAANGLEQLRLFSCTVRESQVKTNADYMAVKLARYGWQKIVGDIHWYEPRTTG